MSIAGIAAAAGVGRITLYGHFSTGAELFEAVMAGPSSTRTRFSVPPTPAVTRPTRSPS
jgi:AcrR family transcriptional regulator